MTQIPCIGLLWPLLSHLLGVGPSTSIALCILKPICLWKNTQTLLFYVCRCISAGLEPLFFFRKAAGWDKSWVRFGSDYLWNFKTIFVDLIWHLPRSPVNIVNAMLLGCQKPRTDISGSATFVFLERLRFLWPPCRTLIFYGNWDLFQWGMCEEILWACCEQKQNVHKFPSSVCQFRWQATLTWLVLDGQYFLGKAYHSVREKQVHASPLCKGGPCVIYKVPPAQPLTRLKSKGVIIDKTCTYLL